MSDSSEVSGGSDWTPRELAGLGATCFGLEPSQVNDCMIIVTTKTGEIMQSHAIGTNDPNTHRERACRLLYIISTLNMAVQQTTMQLHDEVHDDGND